MAFLSIMARFGMDATGFKAGIKQVESASKGLSRDLNSNLKGAIAGAFGTAAIVAAGKATLDYAGQIADLSERLGVSTDALQEFDFAARLSGTNLETFTGFLEKLSVSREEALQGNDELRESFARLGVSLEDLRTKRLEEITRQIGRAVQGGDVQQLMPSLKGVGGRGAGALVPTFRMGLEDAAQQARSVGAIISPEDIAALDEIGDRFTVLAKIIQGPMANAILFLVDGVQGAIDAFVIAQKFLVGTIVGIEGAIRGGRKEGEGFGDYFKRIFNTGAEVGEAQSREYLNQRTQQEAARMNRPQPAGTPNLTAQKSHLEIAREERVAKLQAQLADKEFKLLQVSQQRAVLEERIAKLRKEIAEFEALQALAGPQDEESRIKRRLELLNADEQLKALDVAPPAPSALPADPMVNALERIGGSFGTADQGVNQVRKLEQIHTELRALKQATNQGNNNTSRIAEALT